jgi:hypothetical protein
MNFRQAAQAQLFGLLQDYVSNPSKEYDSIQDSRSQDPVVPRLGFRFIMDKFVVCLLLVDRNFILIRTSLSNNAGARACVCLMYHCLPLKNFETSLPISFACPQILDRNRHTGCHGG